MVNKTFSSLHILLSFFVVKYFIFHFILLPFISDNYQSMAKLYLLLFAFLQIPIMVSLFLLLKKFHKKNILLLITETKSKWLYTTIKILSYFYYLLMGSLIICFCLKYFIDFSPEISSQYYFLIGFLFLIFFSVNQGRKILLRLAPLIVSLILIITLCTFIPKAEINLIFTPNHNFFILIISLLHLVMLPALLLNLGDICTTKYRFWPFLILTILFTTLDIAAVLWPNEQINPLTNFYYLLLIIGSGLIAFLYLFFSADNHITVKTKFVRGILVLLTFSFAFFTINNAFLEMITLPLIVITSFIIISIFSANILALRGKKHV